MKKIGKNNPNYKTGKYCKSFKVYCIDCKCEISKKAKRCSKCNRKFLSGEKNARPFNLYLAQPYLDASELSLFR